MTIQENDTFKDAVKLMIEQQTNGLVVVDAKSKVIGILSSWDLIQHLVPDYLETDKHLAAFEAEDVFAKRAIELAGDPVSKFFTANVHSVHPESTLMEAAATLSEFRIRQLPVVDKEGVLVGYLNRTDLKLVIGDILGIQE